MLINYKIIVFRHFGNSPCLVHFVSKQIFSSFVQLLMESFMWVCLKEISKGKIYGTDLDLGCTSLPFAKKKVLKGWNSLPPPPRLLLGLKGSPSPAFTARHLCCEQEIKGPAISLHPPLSCPSLSISGFVTNVSLERIKFSGVCFSPQMWVDICQNWGEYCKRAPKYL